MNATPEPPDDSLSDEELTTKDRSYSPSSERETEAKQEDADASGDAGLRPGTGGPDDVGDLPVPEEDDLDPATIVARADPAGSREPRHRAGDA